ncbi:hypothetical protein [Jiangella endophytica]|uniref:hypothetical protein n=1 Tax=Jiangella endophytica TaxID=1623398 RepID=UPI000E352B17|nr:hypothetical protein [Jiangella endophytica]
MTAGVPVRAMVPGELAAALARAGRPLSPGPATVLAGPLLSRWALTELDGARLWLDTPADGAAEPAPAPPSLPAGPVRLGVPIALPGAGLGYAVPWPPALLATAVTRGGPGHPAPAELGAGLGRLLRDLHDRGSAAPGTAPAALARVDAAGSLARTDARLAAAFARVRGAWPASPRVALHGEPSTGQLLVAARPAVDDPVLAVLTGWSGRAGGPAWFDVGYLVGDLLEIGQLLHGSPEGPDSWTRTAVDSVAAAVRRGYDGGRPLSAAFWRAAADAAAVKVLDHEARIIAAFGPRPDAVAVLAGLGHTVLDTATALMEGR